jgi:hypothetical protein
MRNFIVCISLLFVGLGTLRAHPVEKSPDRKVLIQKIVSVYTSQIGVREATGHNDGKEVEMYLSTTGFAKGNPWCAAFVTWTFLEANVPAIKSAWAGSWFPPGKIIYRKGLPMKIPPGQADVGGLYSSSKNLITHVFFIDQWPPNDDYAITVEGNTNNAGSAEGDGVYRKRRVKSNIDRVARWV